MGFWDWHRQVDSELLKVLAQVEGQEPIKVKCSCAPESTVLDLSTASVKWQESVLTDPEWWGIEMTFSRETEDGDLRTYVRLLQQGANVGVVLNGIVLARLNYTKYGHNSDSEAIRHVREWIRRRILPEIEAAKTRRDSEARRLLAESDAMYQKYRRKYLP